jgi:hypothetical protein
MNTQRVLATFVVAVLAASVLSVVGLAAPYQQASAQSITITTSAIENGRETFFGQGMLQVIVEDPTADDDDDDSIDVEVDVDSDAGSASQTITVNNTNAGSQRFEFFLVHTDATDTTPADPEADTPLDDDQVLEFGNGAGSDELPVSGLALFEDATFDITVGNVEITVDYEEDTASLIIDRSTYGSTSLMYLQIVDNDANLDPTDSDSFDITAAESEDLFTIDGAEFNDTVTFEETGDNTAIFEAVLQISDGSPTVDDALVFDSESIQLTLNDMAEYTDIDGANNTSTDTDDVSFDIDDVDGELDELGAVTFGSELAITVRDNDQNIDSESDDTITDGLLVESDNDSVEVDLEETEDNSGVFVPDTTNNEIRITFVGDEDDVVTTDDILQLVRSEDVNDITEDITITYQDPLNDDSAAEDFETSVSVTIGAPQVDLPDSAGINDDFTLQITDSNLNDNPRTRDSYTFELDGDGPFPLLRGTTSLVNITTIEFEIEGDEVSFTDALTYTLVETGINTGIFTTELDMADILEETGADVDDGDRIEVTYTSLFDDQSREASDEVAIGKASTGVDFSRSVLPIPLDPDGEWADVVDNLNSFVTLIVTDPDQNVQSSTEDSLNFAFIDDIGTANITQDYGFEVEFDGETLTSFEDYEDSDLADILPDLADDPSTSAEDGISLGETGRTTGVFDEELEFEFGSALDLDDWHNLEITVTYVDADEDEESAGITFRGNDGSVDVDQGSAKAGTLVTITVQDEDLNLDDDTAEEFEASVGTGASYILSVETEDDEIEGGTTTETFRETEPNSGIFEAEYLVGTDIQVTEQDGDDINQATNILITFNDEVDSTGNSGDELEVNVPVVTTTGSIQVTPELVGPGTEITVLIIDSDLDEDPQGTEDYESEDIVEFRSDRSEVGDAAPEIEETGPNTGVFSFSIELVTDEGACSDDDLGDDAAFEAEGGSQPSIGACPGDLISIRYEDEQSGSGQSTTVSQVVEVRSWDPEFVADKEGYAVGDRVTITVSDPDANRDPDIADSLTDIRVFSTSDAVGEELSALETGKSTGVFRLSFTIASDTSSGAITVKQGDRVTVEYTDEFPADFEDEEEDKEFQFNINVAGRVGTDATTPSAPELKDVTGRTLSSLSVGQQAVLSTNIVNNNDESRPFVALVEVRDSSGITVFLAWQTGTLNPSGQAEVGLSWTPEEAGDYEVRTFVISDLANPQILSEVQTSDISVSG